MENRDRELEVKFFLIALQEVENRLQSGGGSCLQPRTHEYNLRFDTPSGELAREGRLLRLRKDAHVRLTYKRGNLSHQGAGLRQEIELAVEDFDRARRFLEALGFQVTWVYEKYRSSYLLPLVATRLVDRSPESRGSGAVVSLDELPFGNFVEIEAPTGAEIYRTAVRLELEWEARIKESYSELFDRLRAARELPLRDLTFENFRTLQVTAQDLGVRPAGT